MLEVLGSSGKKKLTYLGNKLIPKHAYDFISMKEFGKSYDEVVNDPGLSHQERENRQYHLDYFMEYWGKGVNPDELRKLVSLKTPLVGVDFLNGPIIFDEPFSLEAVKLYGDDLEGMFAPFACYTHIHYRQFIGYNVNKYVDMQHVNLEKAVLSYSHLERSNLTGSNLKDADLTGAELDMSQLKEINWEGTILRDACLADANADVRELEEKAILYNTNLGGVNEFYVSNFDSGKKRFVSNKARRRRIWFMGSTKRIITSDSDILQEIIFN